MTKQSTHQEFSICPMFKSYAYNTTYIIPIFNVVNIRNSIQLFPSTGRLGPTLVLLLYPS